MNEAIAETDLRLNEHGVYVRGVDTVEIAMPAKCEARVHLVFVPGGVRIGLATQWIHAAHGFGCSFPPSVRGDVYPSRSAAIVAAAEMLIARWTEELDRCDSAAGMATLRAAIVRLAEFHSFHLSPLEDVSMNPATASPAKPRKTKAKAAIAPTPAIAGDGNRILIEQITPHPDNPRKTFDPAALERLADSIRRSDVLQPVLVRPTWVDNLKPKIAAQQYQLVCGERRYRAAKLAGLTSIPAVVREMTDAEALELMIVENEEREDLNPIELALGLSALTKPIDAGGAGLTHAAAAARFSHEEAWATNLMRLLQLPEAWQTRIASGEIPQTFARAMLPYAVSPAVLGHVEKAIEKEGIATLTREEFERLLDLAVREATAPIDEADKPFYDYRVVSNAFGRLFKLTDEVRAELEIVDLPVLIGHVWQTGRKQRKVWPRAQNLARYEELQEAAKQQKIKKREARRTKEEGKSGSAVGGEPTGSDLAAKRRQQDQQLSRRVEDWAEDLVRAGCCREIESGEWDWLARWFCRWFARTSEGCAMGRASQTQWEAAGAVGHKCGDVTPYEDEEWEAGLKFLDPADDPVARLDSLDREEASLVLDPHRRDPKLRLDRDVVYHLAGLVGVKPADEWKACQGEMLRRFFQLHTLDQLRDLSAELGDYFNDKTTKATAVDILAEAHERKPYAMPAVLKAALPAKRSRKPR